MCNLVTYFFYLENRYNCFFFFFLNTTDSILVTEDILPEELDGILVSMETGLGLALQRAKVWSKYIADIITYVEKKAQLGKIL